ncbi:MAG TPA: hypothetical protein VN493_06510 [Thermoanaerobaculia bacterium]|nr:hypothetical protein [Thermoanaerobaculia bacterium]
MSNEKQMSSSEAVQIGLAGKQVSIASQGRPGRTKAGITDAAYCLACVLG